MHFQMSKDLMKSKDTVQLVRAGIIYFNKSITLTHVGKLVVKSVSITLTHVGKLVVKFVSICTLLVQF